MLPKQNRNPKEIISKYKSYGEKNRGGSTSKVVTTSSNGEVKEYTDKQSIEEVIAPAHEEKQHQTEGRSQLHDENFISKLGTYGDGPEINKVLTGQFKYPQNTSKATKEVSTACKQPENMDIVKEIPDTKKGIRLLKKHWRKEDNLPVLMVNMQVAIKLPFDINI